MRGTSGLKGTSESQDKYATTASWRIWVEELLLMTIELEMELANMVL
jgi:hypothetical protein